MEQPSLDKSEYQMRLQERRETLRSTMERILPLGAQFVWEIGCGHGHFLTAYAEAHPADRCIGIDIASDRIARAVRKQERARLPNLHFLRAEGRLFLDALAGDTKPSMIFVLFPDPWPKKRHNKHRLMQPAFLDEVAKRVGQGTPLYFRTDHAAYAAYTEDLLRAHPDWRLTDKTWPFELETVFQARATTFISLIAVRT